MKDIARESGVNVSTVSRSLSGSYGVSPETRELVLRIAAELDYRPNRVARGLVTGRSYALALVVSDIRNPFFAEVARGAEDAARAAGWELVLCNSDFDAEKQMEYVRSLHEKRVDGILMNSVAALSRKQLEQLAGYGIPIVLLNKPATSKWFSTVCPDNVEGGALAGRYLTQLGHRQIAHLTGPRRHGNMTDRWTGFERALREAGLPKPVVLHGENSFNGAQTLTRALLDHYPECTAIFAANDAMAFGVLKTLAESGIRVPEQMSVIGFDNVEIAAIVHPPLTTIHQLKYEMGLSAVEMLLRMVKHPDQKVQENRTLGVQLVERQSCAPPRANTAP